MTLATSAATHTEAYNGNKARRTKGTTTLWAHRTAGNTFITWNTCNQYRSKAPKNESEQEKECRQNHVSMLGGF